MKFLITFFRLQQRKTSLFYRHIYLFCFCAIGYLSFATPAVFAQDYFYFGYTTSHDYVDNGNITWMPTDIYDQRDIHYRGLHGVDGGDASLAGSALFADIILDSDHYNIADEVLLQSQDNGRLYLYSPGDNLGNLESRYTGFDNPADYIHHLESEGISLDKDILVIPYVGTQFLFFYNNMPDIYGVVELTLGQTDPSDSQFYFGTIRDESSSQQQLDDYLASFRSSSLAFEPLVKIGLQTVSNVILINDKREDISTGISGSQYTKASPSQFDAQKNIIYINKADLSAYGYVVILHEFIQAGLINSELKGYLATNDLVDVNNIADNYFPHFSGYMNTKKNKVTSYETGKEVVTMEEVAALSSYKAFAIGHTYRLLKNHYQQLPSKEKSFATQYFKDVESNKFLSVIEADLVVKGYSFVSHIFDAFSLYGSNAEKADILEFLNAFSNDNHGVGTLVNSTVSKAGIGYSQEVYNKIHPAVNLSVLQ